jgi:hypothetical protein
MVREHDKVGIQVLLAAPPTPLCKALSRHGFFKRFSSERLFPTVTSAVSFARDGNRVVSKNYRVYTLGEKHYLIKQRTIVRE